MARIAIGALVGMVVGMTLGAACQSHAQDGIPDDTIAAAAEAGLDPVSLAGALNSQPGVDLHAYLQFLAVPDASVTGGVSIAGGQNAPLVAGSGRIARVRLTYYTLTGRTYSGGHPYAGSTACSWNFAIGTRFVLPDGETVTCNDRGLLGSSGWLDLWERPDITSRYGPYATVEVVP